MGTPLRDYLDARGESQSDFAARAGVNGGALSTWLSGQRSPDRISAQRVESATGGAVPASSWPLRRRRKPAHKAPKQAS